MTEIELSIVPYTVSADYLATFGADFDSEAIDDAILLEVNRLAPPGVVVHRNGKAFAADQKTAAEVGTIDWVRILTRINLDQIISEHPR